MWNPVAVHRGLWRSPGVRRCHGDARLYCETPIGLSAPAEMLALPSLSDFAEKMLHNVAPTRLSISAGAREFAEADDPRPGTLRPTANAADPPDKPARWSLQSDSVTTQSVVIWLLGTSRVGRRGLKCRQIAGFSTSVRSRKYGKQVLVASTICVLQFIR